MYTFQTNSGFTRVQQVVRTALVDAASVASLMTTTDSQLLHHNATWQFTALLRLSLSFSLSSYIVLSLSLVLSCSPLSPFQTDSPRPVLNRWFARRWSTRPPSPLS